ncbi:MAG: hypothetical protein RBT76_09205 [candidate division Zixibacteria bacterium]|jgi:hypothetical protein|nr:hypothetical protein [candidate division Zixibacteria bacterium]
MLSYELLLYAMAAGGGYLFVVSVILELIERRLALARTLPAELVESEGWVWWGINFVMEVLFYVGIPLLAYAFFYFALPFSGLRAGLAGALYAFTIGAAPIILGLSVRVRLPMPFLLYQLLAYLIKIAGTLTIIAWLYSL